jgi:hypothetical protein
MNIDSNHPDARPLDIFPAQLEEATKGLTELVHSVAAVGDHGALRAHQAEWHVRGVAYHCRNIFEKYKLFVDETSKRAGIDGGPPVAIIMYAPVAQFLMFEFYALVNLSRIALDNLRHLLAPTFKTPFARLPKSISDYSSVTTDCPVYRWLADQPALSYLSDLRNCLVHYRSFATSDNAVVVQEGFEGAEQMHTDLPSLFKAEFRLAGGNAIAVNVFLPDTIFEWVGTNKKLATFTYEQRTNLLSQSREFLRLIAYSTKDALSLLLTAREPKYTFQKPTT